MSKELDEMSKELQGYQIRCAEQEDIIEMLEHEIERLNNSLWSVQAENRKLAVMLISKSTVTPNPQSETPNNNKEDDNEKNESSAESDKDESTPPEEMETSCVEEECPSPQEPEGSNKFDKNNLIQKQDNKPEFKNYQEKVAYECQEFLKKYTFTSFYNEISLDIMGQDAELKKMLAVIYNYIHTLSRGEKPEYCSTVVLTAPSGNGKTALFKSLKTFFASEIPSLICSRKDASKLVPEGYKGTVVTTILSDFAPYQKWDIDQRFGFLWLDEFDKIRFNHDSGPQVQNQLLTYLDGHVEKHGNTMVDTNYIFWVAAGSFNEVRKKKKRAAEKPIGFTSEEKPYDAFDVITREDILQIFSYEVVGRFNLIVNFKRLTRDSVVRIIAKTLEDVCARLRVEAVLSEDYVGVLTKSANSEFGCRQIYSTLFEVCLQAYIEILQNFGIDERPLVVIEGPENFTILDEFVAGEIEYENTEEG